MVTGFPPGPSGPPSPTPSNTTKAVWVHYLARCKSVALGEGAGGRRSSGAIFVSAPAAENTITSTCTSALQQIDEDSSQWWEGWGLAMCTLMAVWCSCFVLIVMEATGNPLMLPAGVAATAEEAAPADPDNTRTKSPLDLSDGLYYAVLLPLLLPTVAIYRFFVWLSIKFYQYN